jgi:DNA-directed RNA polymerase subunit RPC12/RpoP
MSDVTKTAYSLADCDGEGNARSCATCKQEVTVMADRGIRSVLPTFYICWTCKTVWDVRAREVIPWLPGTAPQVTAALQAS